MASVQESGAEDEQSAPPTPPEDAIFEILTRASLETLPACRCVCRQWAQITYEPTFASLHCHRTQSISGYFVQCMKRNRYFSSFVSIHPLPPSAPPPSLDFLPKPVKIEAVAPRGILLCRTQDYHRTIPRYYVCKPATRQWHCIPNPKTRYGTQSIAMVATRTGHLEYKIIRFSIPKRQAYDLRCEIFDSRSKAWRRSNDIRLPPCALLLSHDAAVFVNGAVHWLTHGKSGIFAFNVCYESWKLIPLPERVAKDEKWWRAKRLVKRESRLCLLLVDDEEEWLEIWIMADYKDQRWERKEVVSLEALNKKVRTPFVWDLYSSNVGLAHGWNRVIWHDFCTQKFTIVDSSHANHLPEFFRLESDLIPCEING